MTHIPALPKNWIIARLDEFSEVTQGQSPPGESYNSAGQGSSFLQGKAEFGSMFPTPVKWCSMPSKFAQIGDVLISVRAPVGTTNLADAEYCIGRGLAAIRPLGGMPNRYLLYGIRATLEQLTSNATGTTFPAITGDVLRRHTLPLPPLAEQHRIVEEIEKQLTRLDAAVGALRAAQTKLRRYRASVLNAAVTGRLVPTEAALARAEGRDYEPASVLLERIARERRAEQERAKPRRKRPEPAPVDTSSLPELSEGWAWTTLARVSAIQSGIAKGKRRAVGVVVREVPYLRVANVQRGNLNLHEMKLISATEEEIATLRLFAGDILFTEGGDRDKLGRGWIWQSELDECIHQNHVFRSRLFSAFILPKFISYWSNSLGQEYFLQAGKQTTNLASINLSVLSKLPIAIPPTDEQDRIVTEVARLSSRLDAAEAAVETNLKRANRLRQAILKRAFEGRLVSQDPDDEPAAVLLERIKTEKAAAAQERRRRGRRGAAGRRA